MSAENLRTHIMRIRENMKKPLVYKYTGELTKDFFADINLLQELYGEVLGNAKARYREYSNELLRLDSDITTCFAKLTQFSSYGTVVQILNLAIGKISELVAFVETLESVPPEQKVSKSSYEKLLREKEALQKTVEVMVQYKGVPELNTLLETAKNIQLPTDEYWVLALCSANLIEAVVNKKLEKLGAEAKGSFRQRYQTLCKLIKEKEKRDIQQLLPTALYEGVRNKLDHASDTNRVTPKEAKDISKMVIEFIDEVFH